MTGQQLDDTPRPNHSARPNETLDANHRLCTPTSKQLAGDDIEITRARNRNYCLAEGFSADTAPSKISAVIYQTKTYQTKPFPASKPNINQLLTVQERNPSPSENIPSAPDANPSAGVPQRCRSPRKIPFRRAIREPPSPAARLS